MDIGKIFRGIVQIKMVVLLVAIVLLFVVLFNSGMFGGKDTRIRITCAGDSITYGSGVLKSRGINSYPAQLQTKLGTSYLVSNFGLRNATASEEGDLPYINSAPYHQSLESDPDIVILMLGTNDAKEINWDQSEYEQGLLRIVESYQQLNSKPVVYLLRSPYCFAIKEGGEVEYGIQADVVYGALGESIQRVADQTGVEVIDLFTPTEGKEKLYTDGIHFTSEGYDLISDEVLKFLKNHI